MVQMTSIHPEFDLLKIEYQIKQSITREAEGYVTHTPSGHIDIEINSQHIKIKKQTRITSISDRAEAVQLGKIFAVGLMFEIRQFLERNRTPIVSSLKCENEQEEASSEITVDLIRDNDGNFGAGFEHFQIRVINYAASDLDEAKTRAINILKLLSNDIIEKYKDEIKADTASDRFVPNNHLSWFLSAKKVVST